MDQTKHYGVLYTFMITYSRKRGLTVSKFCYGFFMLEMAFDRDRDLRLYGQKKRESIRPCKRPRQPICTVLRLASYWAHSSEEKLKDRILES